MSDPSVSEDLAEEARRLSDQFAKDMLSQVESSLSLHNIEKEVPISRHDVLSAWSQVRRGRSARELSPALIVQFVLLTLSFVAIIYFVFELTSTELSHVESATMVVAIVGLFYVLATVASGRRGRTFGRYQVGTEREIGTENSSLTFNAYLDGVVDKLA